MKNFFPLMLLAFFCPLSGNAQTSPFLCAADTLQNIYWQYLAAPPAKVTDFAQSRDRVFVATDNGLFFTDDVGGTWNIHPQTKGKKIENLFANDSVVLFHYVRTISIGPYTVPAVKQLEVYRSLNTGLDFNLIFSLDGDSEYFGTVMYPYLWTKFIDLGGGFMYFEHGLPYPGYGTWDPYENARYFSRDHGKTWNQVSLTYTGLYTPMSKVFQNLSVCNDTLLGVQYVYDNTGNGNSGYQINLYPQAVFEGNALKDTLPMPSGFQNFLYFNRDLYTINLGYGNFKTNVTRFEGVLSNSFPTSISADTLFFPNETDQNPAKFWNTDTLLWFEFWSRNVYRSSIQNPQALIFQYKKPVKPSWATCFSILAAGLYVNNAHFETLHSADNGNTWSASFEGLSTAAFMLGDQCGQVLASPRRESYPSSHIYYSLASDGTWQYLDSTLEKTMRWTVGKAFGEYYMSSGSKIYKTDECVNPPVWQISTLNANGWGDTIFQSGNRAFAYRKHCSGCKVFVSSDGETWSESGFHADGTISIIGDTVIQLQKDKVRFSTDLGLTWVERAFPQDFDFSWVVFENDKIIGLNELYSGLQWLVCENLLQADDLVSWHGECIVSKPYHAYTAFGDVIIPAKMVGYTKGIIFLHAQKGLYISNDFSKSWHRLPDLPFKNEYERPHYTTGQIQYGQAEGGNGYSILDGYLYGFTNAHGVWRTDLQPILAQLPEILLHSETPVNKTGQLEIYPNPASEFATIKLPEDFSGGLIYAFDPMMQVVRSQSFTENLVEFRTENMPPGLYFLQTQTKSGGTFVGKLLIAR